MSVFSNSLLTASSGSISFKAETLTKLIRTGTWTNTVCFTKSHSLHQDERVILEALNSTYAQLIPCAGNKDLHCSNHTRPRPVKEELEGEML